MRWSVNCHSIVECEEKGNGVEFQPDRFAQVDGDETGDSPFSWSLDAKE
jgi:hypothetical protein